MKTIFPVFVFSLLPGFLQATEFGNIAVTQNDAGATAASITLSKAAGSTPNFGILGGNRGDFDVSFGTADDVTGGVMLSSVSQNGRDNTAGGDTIGSFFATSATDYVGSGFSNKYWVPIFRTANGDEVNINVACAWFPYSQWLGGFARNSAGTNGGALNTLTASAGISLGTQFVDGSGGVSTVNLTSLAASSTNGVLLVNHAKNEDNYALSRANADGTFTVWIHDNGANGGSYEQDPVAFVYIPVADVGTKQLVATGRVNSDATTAVGGGTFTVTKGGTGQWYLTIPGQNDTTGVLIISPEGGGTNTSDNVVSYQWDVANSRWVIESRDLSGATTQPTLQNGATNEEDVFSFAFFETSNQGPTAAITAPAASGFTAPASFTIEADATDADGTISQVEFLRNGVVIATDIDSPFSFTETALPAGSYSYIARSTDNLGATGVSPAKVVSVNFDPNNIPANTALSFDGVNDYVTMGPAPELNVGGPVGNGLTLECWFRKEGNGLTSGSGSGGVTAVPLFGKGRGESDGSNVDCNIFFGITSGGLLVGDFESQATGLNHPVTATNTPIVNGAWYHAAATFDGATGVWKMYLNGVEVGGTTVSVAGAVPRYDSIQHFGIATAMNSSGIREGAFAGVIDEARVWNRARSAAEIAAAKDLELASGTGLIGRFGLNEGIGLSAASSAGVSIGTLTNGPVWVDGAPFITANTSPMVSLTAPMDNASSFMPFPVTFTAAATDADGSVAKVEFLVDGIKVGEDLSEPYSYDWTPPAPGTYSVRSRAIDNLGAGSISAIASIVIETNPNQPPVVTLASPANGATVSGSAVTLAAGLADPTGDAMTVTFYGRQTTPVAPGPDFSVVAIPDTQYYSQGSPGRANTVTVEQLVGTFGTQTQWVVDNKASRNIAFVSHMGDIVENGNFGGNPIQWERATAAMGNLEKPLAALRAYGIPYGVAPGNHDIDPIGNYDTGSTAFFNQYFGTSRFAGRDYWGGNYGSDNTNNYQLFSASGLDFISIHLAYDTTQNQPILDWADALLKAHPHRRAMVTSHYIIGQGNPATFGAQGSAIYNGLKDNPNLFLLMCGHIHAEGRRSDVFEGRTVYSVLSDYQGLANGGNGFLRTFTFSPANNRIRVESWSPTLNRAASLSDGLPHFDGTYDLEYNMQSPVSDWVALGTVSVPANGTTASLDWTGLEKGKNYEWYVAANDGVNTASSAPRGFTTTTGTPPTVTLDSPLAAATFTSPATINLSATANDTDGTIARVEFYNGGIKLGEDTSAPYEFIWTEVAAGNYDLSAITVDDSGLTAVSNGAAVTVELGDKLPVVALTAPAAGTLLEAPANVTLTAAATDDEAPVVKVEFFSGTLTPVLLGEDTSEPFGLDLTNLGAGAYTFTAKATDSIGQTATSAPVTISIFVEASSPDVKKLSVGTFDPPSWTVVQTSPSPYQFDLPGADVGDLEIKINAASVPFNSGIALANNWSGPASTGNSSNDNIAQPYSNASGNMFVSVLDNTNNNAAGANPGTSEQTSGVGVAVLPYADGFTGASVSSSASVFSGNLPSGVTITKSGGAGTYTVNGLSIAGNLLAFTNGDSGTLADNVCSVRIVNNQWVIDTRDNAGGTQDNEFSFVYLPPATSGVFAGKVSSTGVVTNTNVSASALGVTASVGTEGVDLTFGDGSVINPTTAAIFVTADATNGASGSPAVDNLIAWSASGNSFRVISQDLPEISGSHESIDLRFLVIPFVPIVAMPEVTIAATKAEAGEFGADQALEFTVTRSGSTALDLIVPLVAGGSASASDYSGFASSIVIPATQASATLPLTVLADADAEGSETVTLALGGSPDFTLGTPASAVAIIADKPSQSFYFTNIADAGTRAPGADADGDSNANIVEYFMGTLPADANSNGVLEIPSVGTNTFKVRYPRAKNRTDVSGSLLWSSDLTNWHTSGQSNGTHTVTFTEAVVSPTEANPETVEATATITGTGEAPKIFVSLGVE